MTSALLVIDVQHALFAPVPRPADADAVISCINVLSARARAQGAPVVFIQHETAGGALTHGTPGWQLAAGLEAAPDDLRLRKTTPDSFLRTPLQAWLDERGIRHLVICGYATEFCVDTTVRRAAALGYAVSLAADAHTTHDKPHADAGRIVAHHNATLPDITSFGVCIAAPAAVDVVF